MERTQKPFCIAAYLRTSDLVETRKLYLRRFNIDRRRINQAPSKEQVIRWVKKFIQSGTDADQLRSVHPKSVTSAENMRILKDSVYIQLNEKSTHTSEIFDCGIEMYHAIILTHHPIFTFLKYVYLAAY